jgi:hypothetical protein
MDGTTYRQFALMVTENNSIPISDVNREDLTMRMTEGDRVKITVYNSNSSKPPTLCTCINPFRNN